VLVKRTSDRIASAVAPGRLSPQGAGTAIAPRCVAAFVEFARVAARRPAWLRYHLTSGNSRIERLQARATRPCSCACRHPRSPCSRRAICHRHPVCSAPTRWGCRFRTRCQVSWPDGKPICPRCGSANVHRLKGRSRRRGQIICNTCLQISTVTVGTVMERSHVPLNKWALAFHMMAETGISAKQLQRELKLGSYRTARFMCSRNREGMKQASLMGRPRPGAPRAPFGPRTPAFEG